MNCATDGGVRLGSKPIDGWIPQAVSTNPCKLFLQPPSGFAELIDATLAAELTRRIVGPYCSLSLRLSRYSFRRSLLGRIGLSRLC